MKKQFLTYLFLFAILHCSAQLISTEPVEISTGPIQFNPDIIKKNKVKTIVLDIVDKPDGKIIVDKDATQGFEFDEKGRVVRYYYTILNRTQATEVDVPALKKRGKVIRPATTKTVMKFINDTIFTNVFYDNLDRVILKRSRSGDYYDAYYYEYNDQGKIRKEMHCRETNISENKNVFKMGVQTVLSSETFTYENLTPTQVKKKCMNDEGREYKKAIINYDAKGNKLSESYDFIVSWMHQEGLYEYNSNGYLSRRILKSNESGELKQESTFEYDANGHLITEKKIQDTIVINEVSYLFDDFTKLVKSHIDRDFKNASIGIVKYAYTFY
ncbi:MAG: hypothetical protein JWO44_1032 [Bacteroidetes bacterium]|nr:hypothetical protein [Bacteroidota bacterium]